MRWVHVDRRFIASAALRWRRWAGSSRRLPSP